MERFDEKLSELKPAATHAAWRLFFAFRPASPLGTGCPECAGEQGEMFMMNFRKWVSIALAMSLLASAIAPTAAMAWGGKTGKQIENGDPIEPPPVDQTGEPDPGAGRAFAWGDFWSVRQIVIASMRLQFVVPLSLVSQAGSVRALPVNPAVRSDHK